MDQVLNLGAHRDLSEAHLSFFCLFQQIRFAFPNNSEKDEVANL